MTYNFTVSRIQIVDYVEFKVANDVLYTFVNNVSPQLQSAPIGATDACAGSGQLTGLTSTFMTNLLANRMKFLIFESGASPGNISVVGTFSF